MTVLEQHDLKKLHALEVIETDTETFVHAVYSVVKRDYGKITHLRLPNGQTIEAIPHPDFPFLPPAPQQEQEAAPAEVAQEPAVTTPSTTEQPPDASTTPPVAPDTSNGKKSKATAASATDTAQANDAGTGQQNGG